MSTEPVKVVITAEFQQLITALNTSTKQIQDFGNKVKTQNKSMGDSFGGLKEKIISGLGIGSGMVIAEKAFEGLKKAAELTIEVFKSSIEETMRLGEEIENTSMKTGLSAQSVLTLDVAMKMQGKTVEDLDGMFSKMSKTLAKNGQAFVDVGVAENRAALSRMSVVKIMDKVGEKLVNAKTLTEKATIAISLFGKAGVQSIPMLQKLHESLEESSEMSKSFGLNMESVAENADSLEKASGRLNAYLMAVKVTIGQELMPVLLKLAELTKTILPNALFEFREAIAGLKIWFIESKTDISNWYEVLKVGADVVTTSVTTVVNVLKKAKAGDLAGALATSKDAWKALEDRTKKAGEKIVADTLDMKRKVATITANMLVSLGGGVAGMGGDQNLGLGGEGTPKVNNYEKERTKLKKEQAGIAADLTSWAKQEATWKKLQAEQEERIANYQEQVNAGTLDPEQAVKLAEESNALLADQQEKFLQENEKASDEFYQELYSIRQDREEKHAIALLDIEKAAIERRMDLNQIGAMEAIVLLEENEEKKFQVEKTALDKRLALYQLDPEKNAKLISKTVSDQVALSDKQGASRQGFNFQRQDFAMQSNGPAGGLAALESLQAKSRAKWQQWADTVTGIYNSVQNAFGNSINAMLTGQMTPLQALKSMWSDLGATVSQAISKIIAQKITEWMLDKAIAVWKSITAKKEIVENGAKTGSNITAAASKTFEAHAAIPWIGIAVAVAMIAVMLSTMKSIKGRAVGGLVSHPELTLLGERGPEVVAPERDFNDWAGNLTRNVLAQERRVQNYQRSGAGYARTASSAMGGAQQVFPNATIITTDARQWQDMVAKGQRGYDRRYS